MGWNLTSLIFSELHLVVLNFQVDKHHEKAVIKSTPLRIRAISSKLLYRRNFNENDAIQWEYTVVTYTISRLLLIPLP